jgi:hypothetical protein
MVGDANIWVPSGVEGTMKRSLIAALFVLSACSPEASRVADGPSPTVTTAGGYRDEPVEWFLRSISDDGKTIALTYQMSGVASECEREGRTSATESADRVVVTARKSVTLDRNRACTEELAYVKAEVTLEQPLGERSLVGCRPPKSEPSEDDVCRDLKRSQDAGVFEGEGSPPPPVVGY